MLAKGFIRVVEAILLSLVLLAFFLPNILSELPGYKIEDWENVAGYVICTDLLNSLDAGNYFDSILVPDKKNPYQSYKKNIEILKNITEKAFPSVIDFEYEIKNVPNFSISIGMSSSCSLPNEIFEANYLPIEMHKNSRALSSLFLDNYSVYVVCGNTNLSKYKDKIFEVLSEGKGIVLIRNFNSQPDYLTKELFQINYTPGGFSSGNIVFNNLSNLNTARIAKRFVSNVIRVEASGGSGIINLGSNNYFFNISAGQCVNISGSGCPCLYENDSCILGSANITIYRVSNQWFEMRLSSSGANRRNYIFSDSYLRTVKINKYTVLSSSDGTRSLANARVLENYPYETAPRLFWMYDFNKTKDDLKLLLKTAIIWASGEHFFVFNKNIPKGSEYCEHYYYGLNGNNIPFVVRLFYWGY